MIQNPNTNLLDALLLLWKEDPTQSFTISQVASRLNRSRREIKGALEILFELGFLKTANWTRTHKQYRFNSYFTYQSFLDRIFKVIPQSDAEEPHYSFEEWQNKLTPIIEKLIPTENLRWYLANLWDYTSTHAFARTIYQDGARQT